MNCVNFRERSSNRLTVVFISENGGDIDNATVPVTIVHQNTRKTVDGNVWPDFMTLVSAIPPSEVAPTVERPNASYTVVFDSDLEIVRDKFYFALIEMTSPLGDRYEEQLIRCSV